MFNLGPYPGKACPNIILYPSVTDRILEGVALFLFIGMWISAFYVYAHSSENVVDGMPVFLRAGIGTLVMLCGIWGAYMPIRLINFPFRLTERNQITQYRLVTRFSRILTICFGLMGLFQLFMGTESLLGVKAGLFKILLSSSFLLMVICMGVYYWFAFRNK